MLKGILLSLVLCAVQLYAHDNYTGRSGAPGRDTCASSCHGGPVMNTVQVIGFPTVYTPGAAYLLTIKKVSGGTIVNFNASCRVGASGTTNAGTITSGLQTSTYNVTGETNGVHFTSANHDSGRFTWTAPAAGTGLVKLYAGAIQTDIDGDNNTIVLTATEAAPLPGVATLPNPANMAADVPLASAVSWTAGAGATSHDVYFGTTPAPVFIGNQTTTTYDPAGDLLGATTYYWRIDERNAAGLTPGAVWQFVTHVTPAVPTHLMALVEGTGIRLYWEASAGAVLYNVYRDTLDAVAPTPANLVGTTSSTNYLDDVPAPVKANYVVTAQ